MDKLVPWFNLKRTPGIGNLLFKRLLDRFSSPRLVFEASREQLLSVEGITPRLAAAIASQRKTPYQVEAELEAISNSGCRVLTYHDDEYPRLLRQIPDPPPCLYIRGQLEPTMSAIAVVGSRNATGYGKAVARRLSADLATRRLTVVSGMALGIDTWAHKGALRVGGQTVAVMGTGLNRVYPAENRKLYAAIAESGAIVSELGLDAGPDARHFPARNRIISGMALGTLVVEATLKSGSLITARLAAEQNREVFAVPGSIDSFKSTGTHSLIKQGAKLVENARDILEELPPGVYQQPATDGSPTEMKPSVPQDLSPREGKIVAELDLYPVHIDELVRKLALDPGELAAALLQLELKGVVSQKPGSLFSLNTR
ncbi:MAG: DNA-protecting protein DprA [Desulfobacterales bacterium]|nr:DNA-protecting protein DprA [Desulfobacterales bacterium]